MDRAAASCGHGAVPLRYDGEAVQRRHGPLPRVPARTRRPAHALRYALRHPRDHAPRSRTRRRSRACRTVPDADRRPSTGFLRFTAPAGPRSAPRVMRPRRSAAPVRRRGRPAAPWPAPPASQRERDDPPTPSDTPCAIHGTTPREAGPADGPERAARSRTPTDGRAPVSSGSRPLPDPDQRPGPGVRPGRLARPRTGGPTTHRHRAGPVRRASPGAGGVIAWPSGPAPSRPAPAVLPRLLAFLDAPAETA
ncbi:hypothetical protein SCANM63S_09661 [Streptomyces canarius]